MMVVERSRNYTLAQLNDRYQWHSYFLLIMQNIIIRSYRQDDFNKVSNLWINLGLGNPERGDNHQVIEQTIEKGGCFLVMEENVHKAIVGTSWITNDGRRLYLHHFGIAADYQRKGLAKKLLAASLDFARETNLQIKLEVGNENIPALNLYRNAGFKPLGDYQVLIIRKYN
jgi:ribosomal protein S18 acetylase RimI-like enzyme